jgi:TonB family protein
VKQAGFGDAQPPATASEPKVRAESAKPATTPVEVLQKPTPVYTDEARKLHIEGEVLLEVQFGASGTLHVLRVVRGLGHGLDEAAVAAAQKIRYKPATRAGQPVDSTATLHIVFQIA